MLIRKIFLSALFCAGALFSLTAAGIRIELNGQKINADFKDVNTGTLLKSIYPKWIKDEANRSSHLVIESTKPLSKKWQTFEFSFIPQNSGSARLMLRGQWAKRTHIHWVEFDHLEVTGANVANPSFEMFEKGIFSDWYLRKENMLTNRNDAFVGKNFLRAAHDFYASQYINVTNGKKVTVKFRARAGEVENWHAPSGFLHYPVSAKNRFATNYPPEYYRYFDAKVKLLPLRDKGIKPEALTLNRNIVNAPIPEAEFITAFPESAKTRPAVKKVDVPVSIAEENGIARTAQVRFGFPLPEKTLYDLKNIALFAPDKSPVPAQFSAIGFWPDKSIKWVLIQFPAALKAKEDALYTVSFGADVKNFRQKSPLKYTDSKNKLTVDTGKIQAVIDKKNFALLSKISADDKYLGSFAPDGFTITDENGKKLSSAFLPPEKIVISESGPRRLSVKVKGVFGNNEYSFYTVLLGFTAGSPVVDMEITLTNANLKTEFTDITSFDMVFCGKEKINSFRMDQHQIALNKRIFQKEEKLLELDGKTFQAQLSGSGAAAGDTTQINFALKDAAFRYPKAFHTTENKIVFELLPALPDAKFGTHLPHYLQFPFCEGKYRMKWGMSFTERIKIDFTGTVSAEQLNAGEIIPVIDRDYLASTKAIAGIPAKSDHSFDKWDQAALDGFRAHMVKKEKERAYGFLNYGDSFGERSRNWTNNEYDLPHGLFMLFARTGNKDVFRWAVKAAQHQADVDIIHAYPDPYYFGVNAQHGVGHTGVSHQRFIKPATWSYPVDITYTGINGHTWSEGMLDCWSFTGDQRVMDAALELGEHLTRYTAPNFQKLGTHERSGGWSMKALIAYYKTTGNKKYLDAMTRIAKIAMSEQKFNKGGAWAHKMPHDHDGGSKNAYGNTVFLIGILSNALREYHLATGDPAAKKSLISAALWQKRNWDDQAFGFPYTASWDNKPYFPSSAFSNILALPGLTYGGWLNNDLEILDIAKKIVDVEVINGMDPVGKMLAVRLYFIADAIDAILQFQKSHPEFAPYSYNGDKLLHLMRKKVPSFHLRGPDQKEFLLVLKQDDPVVVINRTLTGARPQSRPDYLLEIVAADGKKVFSTRGSVKASANWSVPLTGKKGDRFKILINDEMGGFWDVKPSDKYDCFASLKKNTLLSNVSPGTFYFTVPAGTDKFSFEILGVHPGLFKMWIFDPEGKIAGHISGVNDEQPFLPWLKLKSTSLQKTLTVNISPAKKTAEVWKVLILASGNVKLNSSGILPWLALKPVLFEN